MTWHFAARVVFALALVALFTETQLHACTCGSTGPERGPDELVRMAIDAGSPVFVGEVLYSEPYLVTKEYLDADGNPRTRERRMTRLLFAVHRGWNAERHTAWAVTRSGGGPACGVNWQPGRLYVVKPYTNERGERELGLCSRSLLASNRVDLSDLPEPGVEVDWSASKRRQTESRLRAVLSTFRSQCRSQESSFLGAIRSRKGETSRNELVRFEPLRPSEAAGMGLWLEVFYREDRQPRVARSSGVPHPVCWTFFEAEPLPGNDDLRFHARLPPYPQGAWARVTLPKDKPADGQTYRVSVRLEPVGRFY